MKNEKLNDEADWARELRRAKENEKHDRWLGGFYSGYFFATLLVIILSIIS